MSRRAHDPTSTMEMINHEKFLHRAASNLSSGPPLYTSSPSFKTPGFYFAITVYPALVTAFNLGTSPLFTWGSFGVWPINTVCECPSNAETFGADSVYHEGCVDNTSEWYTAHNFAPPNQTFVAEGWFSKTEWSRETLRKVQMTQTSGVQTVEATYSCPVWRPFWAEPVDYVGIIMMIFSLIFLFYVVACSFVTRTSIFHDRVEVEYAVGGSIEAGE